ncbi:MAG: hypothetical protein ACJA0U_002771 [Salibacteraceae bacterium]|jgi:hypothetical protein
MVTQFSFSQEAKEEFSVDDINELKSTNRNVVAVQILFAEKEFEKSLKLGLEIELSEVKLNLIDRFYLFQTIAKAFSSLNAYGSAFEYAKKAIGISNSSEILFPQQGPAWISPFYAQVDMHDSAIFYYQQSADLALLRKDTATVMGLYNNIGYTNYLNNNLDSAIHYFNITIGLNKNNNEAYNVNSGLAYGNLALVFYAREEYYKALANSKIDAQHSKLKNRNSYLNAMNLTARCYYQLNKYEESKNILLALSQLKNRNIASRITTLKLLAKVYHKLKDNDQGYYCMEKYTMLEDSVRKNEETYGGVLEQLSAFKVRNIQKDLELTERKEKLEKSNNLIYQKDLELAKKKAKFKNRIYSISLVFFIFIILISIVYFKNRQKKKFQINQLKYELLSVELNNRKKDLSNVVTNLNYKRKFIDGAQDKLKAFKQQPKEELLPNLSKLIREFENYKIADKSLEVFQSDFEKVNLTFFKTLGEKFPLLTENEKEVCGFIVLKLSSKDIASIRNITPNAVKKSRQNIRKKLPITSNHSLTYFLENI